MQTYTLFVRELIRETPDALTIVFSQHPEGAFEYLPGQYLTLIFTINGQEERRAYSLCSSPYTDAFLAVTVKRVPEGKVSGFINRSLMLGDAIEALPPMGRFTVAPEEDNTNHYVLIGGGSGITPLMSMIKSVLEKEPLSKLTLIYANRNEDQTIFRRELAEFEQRYPGKFRVVHVLETPSASYTGLTGRLDRNRLMNLFQEIIPSDSLTKLFYMCGPSGLMEETDAALQFLNIPKDRIHRELFTSGNAQKEAVTVSTEESDVELKRGVYTVHLKLDGKVHDIQVGPSETILDAAIEMGLQPPFACRVGVCCTCRAMVHSGAVEMDETEGLSDSEIEDGFVLTCQAHPLMDHCEVEYR